MDKPTDSTTEAARLAGFFSAASTDKIEIIRARANPSCACGLGTPMGDAKVTIGGVTLLVLITPTGLRWPAGVNLSPETAAMVAPLIEAEWLDAIARQWAKNRATAGARR